MNNQPNLYICTDSFGVSGVTTQAYYLARGMVQQGWNVHVICYTTTGNYYQAFQKLPIKIHQIDTLSNNDFHTLYTFRTKDTIDISRKVIKFLQKNSVIDQNAPGVIVLNYMLSMFFILDQIPANIGRVFVLHSDEKFYYELLSHFSPHLDGIIAGSSHINQQANIFLKSVGLYPPSAVIPYGIDVPSVIEAYKLKIIYCGRLSEYQKRIFDTLEIAYLLKQWRVNFHLTLVGDESNRDVLKLRIRHLDLEDCVRIIGPLTAEQLVEQFKLHHIFLQVSEFEGLSIALLQAMANGLIPVVSKVASGVTEIVEHGVNGYFAERGDVHSFASILQDLATDLTSCFQKLNTLRNSGIEALIAKGCTAEKMVNNYAIFFDRVLSFNDLNFERRIKEAVNQDFPLETISPQSNIQPKKRELKLFDSSGTDKLSVNKITYIQENPTITFFLDSLRVGGVQTFVQHMLLNLHKHGWNARLAIYYNNRNNPEVIKLEKQGIPVVQFSYSDDGQQIPIGISNLKKDCKGIIIPNYISQIYNAKELALENIAVAHIFHADESFYYDIFQENLHKLKAGVAVSQVCYQKAKDILDKNTQSLPLERIPYGVKMNSVWQEKNSSKTLKIIYSGRIIEHQKCIFEIPELAALAKRKGISCQWTLVGEGEDADLLLHRIYSLRVEDCVHLVGQASPHVISNLLNENDVFILTSQFEGLPLSLLEAMGHGCVPIVYDIPSGIHEVIQHEHNGFIIPYGQRVAFVEALTQLSLNPDMLKQISYHAWETVFPAYSVSNMVSRYVNFFEEVLLNYDN
ncbi:MAG: glycosyltransferase family 4 protein [Scytonematopsis contorta HA4267-MV1]|jgi:glycosyltransferase involved in cell wall biosynthesis|nr:glycosyltransferase family 4 protein [Scytonematopsis contorta HA4267-MV1]